MEINSAVILIIVQLIFLEGILSIDNAAILGALVASLPEDHPIAWPRRLKKLGDMLHPFLGNQRSAALRVGLLGAYAGRALMLLLANFIIHNPWLKLLGAAYLIHLAFDSLSATKHGEEHAATRPVKTHGFWMTVLTVELMDLVFSLDNVIAAVSLSNKLWVVMLGVAIGIVAMRFAAGIFSYLVQREPILKHAAYILVLSIGIQLVLDDLWKIHVSDLVRFGISVSVILGVLAYARFKVLQVFRPVLVWLSHGFAHINEIVNWALVPVVELLKLLWKGSRLLLHTHHGSR